MTTTDHNPDRLQLSRTEFVALMAMLMATVAFSIDAMLPALDDIADQLSPNDPNHAQLIVTSFVLGMGLGTLFVGPLSDTYGRRPLIGIGALIYCAGALLAWHAHSLETLLAARVVQGIGAAGARVIALAIIRDLFSGRAMAQLVSFVIVVFTLVPVIAPTLGAGLIALFGWRGIFPAFVVFSMIATAWLYLRQPETLAPENRRPLSISALLGALHEIITHPVVRICVLIHVLCFGILFAVLSSTQMVFDITFGLEDSFHLWFGGIALTALTGGMLNAAVVVRLGMRRVVTLTIIFEIIIGTIYLAGHFLGIWSGSMAFVAYLIWVTSVFWMAGLTLGNLNALAMEPMGHIAGMAATVISAMGTVGAVIIAIPLGQLFDGTPVPIAIGVWFCAVLAFFLVRQIPDREATEA
ncbi:MAG: multidrug effflux MFS transporter [Pseudomonadota bacterium]